MSQHKNSINEYQNKIRLVREMAILTERRFILIQTQHITFLLIMIICLDMYPQQAHSAMATLPRCNKWCRRVLVHYWYHYL